MSETRSGNELGIENKKGAKQLYAYEKIKEAIIKNVYEAQKPLNEKDLCTELGGISRTPVRDALRRLTCEGLVEYIPGKGAIVSEVSFTDLLEICEVRLSIECMAVQLFIERAEDSDLHKLKKIIELQENALHKDKLTLAITNDNNFHSAISEGTKNSRVETLVKSLLQQSSRGAYMTVWDVNRVRSSLVQHIDIYKAIEMKDKQLAHHNMNTHLKDWMEYLINRKVNSVRFNLNYFKTP
ncbi:MAG: GntR family transcriptional regulator [Christensenellales bacterium]|jgi:DNA-binding GntR family transcriptional regulator